ncbi:hypothetical protein PHLGIDRAFT_285698 [Phlebiopsis gigantea 11061_1 CR5-6]|uniref:Postreplication repair E3 ubiquitin-protein ligase RAD18 n=1 Tax=Phlebiopsis gigantea (strain 11061_1 CR5-6) TaxID=745531 RepID=A0A0C3RRE4_PHLG1|nr:hypothetical protein PHLGIDRAFT_285698 [Phlebiopsis gigantea 11061_1 CR5-6]
MSDDVAKFLDADIPDPTDFPADAPGLRQLDEALRCTMCRELFEAPVTVNCPHGHCFCSMCIRTALATKDECPLCRHAIREVHLRRNTAVEDAVRAWGLARTFVLQVLREKEEAKAATVASKYFSGKPKSKKRRRTPELSSDDEVVEVGERNVSHSLKGHTSSSSSGVVPCPICNKSVPMQNINNHIDQGCPSPKDADLDVLLSPSSKSKGKQKQEWSKLFQGGGAGSATTGSKKGKGKSRGADQDADPLPKIAYDTVTQKRLREILEELDLPTTGDRATMSARHSRWVNMFNANLDASPSQRKSVKQLMLELRRWEEAEEKKKTRAKLDAKDFDSGQYQKDNKTTFARLVEAAKPKAPKKSQSPHEGPPASSLSPSDGDSIAPPRRTEVVTIED